MSQNDNENVDAGVAPVVVPTDSRWTDPLYDWDPTLAPTCLSASFLTVPEKVGLDPRLRRNSGTGHIGFGQDRTVDTGWGGPSFDSAVADNNFDVPGETCIESGENPITGYRMTIRS